MHPFQIFNFKNLRWVTGAPDRNLSVMRSPREALQYKVSRLFHLEQDSYLGLMYLNTIKDRFHSRLRAEFAVPKYARD